MQQFVAKHYDRYEVYKCLQYLQWDIFLGVCYRMD